MLPGFDMNGTIIEGDALELSMTHRGPWDLVVTDPPYAFGATVDEHAISATVACTLREVASTIKPGGWMIIMCASSWRSMSYMVESVRGIVDPVRTGRWVKPNSKTKVSTGGWAWASAEVIAFRKGKSQLEPRAELDWIKAEPIKNGRRAELPPAVADWMVQPFAVDGGAFLDPFAGSGAIVEAAQRAGMSAVGFDRRPGRTSTEQMVIGQPRGEATVFGP